MNSINLNWSANSISTNYTKCLVGFDLRRKSTLKKVFLTSDDENVCYSDLWGKYDDIKYSLNLFPILPSRINGLSIPEDAVVIAFDLPLSLAEAINNSRNFATSTLSIELVSINENWKFLGYDVADPIGQYSAFYGFEWESYELNEILKPMSIALNENGIISEQQLAINAAIHFDELIPEHAPFSPCGVWIFQEKKLGISNII